VSRLAAPLLAPFVASDARLEILRARRAMRRITRLLFSGKFKAALIDTGISNHQFRRMLASTESGVEAPKQLVVGINLVKRAWKTHADILNADPVLVSVEPGFEAQSAAIKALRKRCLFDHRYHEAAMRCFTDGEAALRVDSATDGAVIHLDSNDIAFPVGAAGADGQPTVWERRWILERPDPANPRRSISFLRIERHRAPLVGSAAVGVIEQEAWPTKSSDVLQSTKGLQPVPLDLALGLGHGLESVVATGASRALITQLVTYRIDDEPQPSIDAADLGLIDMMVAGLSRMARTMEGHGQPKARVHEGMVRDGTVQWALDFFVDPDRQVEYIQAQFNWEAMSGLLATVLQWLIVSLDMAASLLGYKPAGGSAPDSFDKLRLEATIPLANARRVALLHGDALERVFETASLLESRRGDGWPVGPVHVAVRADLPKDTVTRAEEQGKMRALGLTSEIRSLAAVHGDDQALAVQTEIRADEARATRLAQEALMGGAFGDTETNVAAPAAPDEAGEGGDGGEPPRNGVNQ